MVFTQSRGCRCWRVFRCAISIASITFPLVQTRDRLRCLATGVGVGRIFGSSMSFSSVENGDVKTFRCRSQMASFTEYIINERDPADVYLHWDCNYQLDGDVSLSVEQTGAWCYHCSMVVAAEHVPSLAALDARIADLDDPNHILLVGFGRAALDRERVALPIRRSWRSGRQSPARCLECGSTDIFALDTDDCTEPRNNKRFRVTSGGHASMCWDIVRRLSPEGEVTFTDDPAKNIKFG